MNSSGIFFPMYIGIVRERNEMVQAMIGSYFPHKTTKLQDETETWQQESLKE